MLTAHLSRGDLLTFKVAALLRVATYLR